MSLPIHFSLSLYYLTDRYRECLSMMSKGDDENNDDENEQNENEDDDDDDNDREGSLIKAYKFYIKLYLTFKLLRI